MTIKMAAMTWTRTDISDKFSVIFSHGIRSIGACNLNLHLQMKCTHYMYHYDYWYDVYYVYAHVYCSN